MRKRAELDKSLPLKKRDPERIDLGSDGIDEDGHYDETKDRRSLKTLLKKEFPEAYKEYIKADGIIDEDED